MSANRFDVAKRERFLAFTEAGWPLATAAARSGTTPQTVQAWLARGRAGEGEAADFARRFDELLTRRRSAEVVEQANVIGDGDALDPHECARRFALKALGRADPFVATEPILMAELSEPDRLRAIKLSGPPSRRPRRRR